MKNILKVLCLLVLVTFFAGCPKDDTVTAEPAKAYSEQYPIDEAAIDDFLATHFVTVDGDYNTTFTEIQEGGTETPIKDMPNLAFKMVDRNDLTYKLYYLVLNEGIGESPIKVDSAFVSYKGTLTDADNTTFDSAENPVWFMLEDVIPGWGEIIPQFKSGTSIENPNGTVTYQDFGAGVMFLPSSFGYYNGSIGVIPQYSPLIFNFKLINQKHIDHDSDRVLSVYEYYDPTKTDGSLLDTDGDGVPDYLDVDDDNDGTITKEEVKYFDVNGDKQYYEFANIPTCSGGTLKKHLDSSCQ
ncbi:FKBP-type peptidyl-prolyl cis-trans isomerase [Flavobacterium gelidilacus]|uniref:FKBP-type peptidyl-prolyl cis-trans isomerase n=1 Tax=Flavobacterium gelidilacus TaxID=206041 RepID=UPI00041107E0|nr:FKBP-type peptidyl-prolyl cis-trans isomerase [Flavobacterium gelidilacus]